MKKIFLYQNLNFKKLIEGQDILNKKIKAGAILNKKTVAWAI